MSKQAFYNGILYQIEYQPELSNNDYTQHKVYHIKTEEEYYGKVRKVIVFVMEEELGYKQCPSMTNAFHPYYKFTYDD